MRDRADLHKGGSFILDWTKQFVARLRLCRLLLLLVVFVLTFVLVLCMCVYIRVFSCKFVYTCIEIGIETALFLLAGSNCCYFEERFTTLSPPTSLSVLKTAA